MFSIEPFRGNDVSSIFQFVICILISAIIIPLYYQEKCQLMIGIYKGRRVSNISFQNE
jgi:hypothetical protein